MCRKFAKLGIIDVMAGAIKDEDQETIESIVYLIENGGEDADAFFAHINEHPDAALIRREVPQLFN